MTRNEFIAHLLLRGFMQSASIAPTIVYHNYIKPPINIFISVYIDNNKAEIAGAGETGSYTNYTDALKRLDNLISEVNDGDR